MLEGGYQVERAGEPPARGGLADSRFLAEFENPEEQVALEAVARPARSLRASADLVREGDANDQLFILTEGWACRYKTAREGCRQIVALILPGDVANLDALMFGCPDFGVRTLTPATVVAIPCDDALALVSHHAGIARVMTRLALVENAVLSQWALCLGRMTAQQRLAHLFCELAARLLPDNVSHGIEFDMPLTQEQIADTLGLTPVHVNRTLQLIRDEGLIETANRKATLPDVARLYDVAGFDPSYLHSGRAPGLRPLPAIT